MDRLLKAIHLTTNKGDTSPNLAYVEAIQKILDGYKETVLDEVEESLKEFGLLSLAEFEKRLKDELTRAKKNKSASAQKGVNHTLQHLEAEIMRTKQNYERSSISAYNRRMREQQAEEDRRAGWIAASDTWPSIRPPPELMLHPEVIEYMSMEPPEQINKRRAHAQKLDRQAYYHKILTLAGERNKKWKIDSDLSPFDPKSDTHTWTVGKTAIGEGATGVVFPVTVYRKCAEGKDGLVAERTLAVKQFSLSGPGHVNKEHLSSHCAAFLKSVKYPHLVNTLGFDPSVFNPCAREEQFWMFMEFVSGGVLTEVLAGTGAMRESDMIPVIVQMARGLQHLHGLGLVHRDMKAANVLLSDTGCAKIADLDTTQDTSSTLWREPTDTAFQGTEFWLAPEAARGNFSARSDVWALGCVMLEMLTRKLPWEMHEKVKAGTIRLRLARMEEQDVEGPPIPEELLSYKAQDVFRKIFVALPYRIGIPGLLEDPWLQLD